VNCEEVTDSDIGENGNDEMTAGKQVEVQMMDLMYFVPKIG